MLSSVGSCDMNINHFWAVSNFWFSAKSAFQLLMWNSYFSQTIESSSTHTCNIMSHKQVYAWKADCLSYYSDFVAEMKTICFMIFLVNIIGQQDFHLDTVAPSGVSSVILMELKPSTKL